MTWAIIVVALLALSPGQAGGSPPRQSREQKALHALSISRPDINWDLKSALNADFDCDGSPDEAFLGRAGGKIYVGVVWTAFKQPEILEFGVDSNAQAAICQEPAKLEIESLNYDPTDEVGKIDGFRQSRRCKGLLLSGGECDPVHLYWNYGTKHLAWWRQ